MLGTLRKKIIGDSLSSIAASGIFMLGTLIITKVLSVNLVEKSYGQYNYLNSVLTLIMALPYTALIQGISRQFTNDKKSSSLLRWFHDNRIYILILFFLKVNLVLYLLKVYEIVNLFSFSLYVVLELYKLFISSFINHAMNRALLVVYYSLEFGLKLSIFAFVDITVDLIFIAFSVTSIFQIIFFEMRSRSIDINRSYIDWSSILRFAIPIFLLNIFIMFREVGTRWFIEYTYDYGELANYAVVYSGAALLPAALQTFINNYSMPKFYSSYENNPSKAYDLLMVTLKFQALALILFSFVYVFLSDFLITLLFDMKYRHLKRLMAVMYFGQAVFFFGQTYGLLFYFTKNTIRLVLPNVVSFVCLILGLLVFRNFELFGIVISQCIAMCSLTLIIIYRGNEKRKKDIDCRRS